MECETTPLPGPSSAVAPTSCAASVASLGSTGSGDKATKQAEMVASLQARKAQLEAKLAAKNEELKMLCIQEAELTGVLPPEIPLEPGETPPTLRRRVGTSFTLPESLLNKLRSTEEEGAAAVELEIKIQTGIAEAALGLANDTSASKQVRRKHRLMYQQSQRRLQDLETKLNTLKEKQEMQETRPETPTGAQPQKPTHQQQSYQQLQQHQQQLKHRKKPRPPVDNDSDIAEVDGMLHAGGISLSPLGQLDRDIREGRLSSALTASSNTVGLPLQPTQPRHSSYRYSTIDSSWNIEGERSNRRDGIQGGGGMGPNYWNSSIRQDMPSPGSSRYTGSRYPPCTLGDAEESIRPTNQRWKRDRAVLAMSRFGSLDRRRGGTAGVGTNGTNSTVNNIDEVEPGVLALLPSQTYPEHSLGHSLVRTQSLGSVEATRPRNIHHERDSTKDGSQTIERKLKEKEWYETSLDVAPVLSPQGQGPTPGAPGESFTHPPLQASLSQPPPHSHLYQSHPQLHHSPSISLSQSHSHSHLPQVQVPPHLVHSHQNTLPHPPSIAQSPSHPQLHTHSQPTAPQLPPHPQFHQKLSSAHWSLSVHIPSSSKPNPPPLPPPQAYSAPAPALPVPPQSVSQAPAIPPHGSVAAPAPPLPPHPSSQAAPHPPPPPLPPSHSNHLVAQLPPQLPPHLPPHGQPPPTPAPHPHLSHHSPHPPPVPPHFHPHPLAPPIPTSHPPLSPKSDDGPLSPPHVPLESPKNHMVVQAGSWQPYREVKSTPIPFPEQYIFKDSRIVDSRKVTIMSSLMGHYEFSLCPTSAKSRPVTKPFEMSDFYKYSTKFRKQMQQSPPAPPSVTLSPDGAPQSPQQQKGVYQPLQPLTCQAVDPTSVVRSPVHPGAAESNLGSPTGKGESLADAFSNEMLAWFQDQRAPPPPPTTAPPSGPPPRSATLV